MLSGLKSLLLFASIELARKNPFNNSQINDLDIYRIIERETKSATTDKAAL